MRPGWQRAPNDGMIPAAEASPSAEGTRHKAALQTGREGRQRRIDTLFLVVLFIGAAAGANRLSEIIDGDIWWHLRTGRWILQHRAVPFQDIFSSAYGSGKAWIAYHWLFEIFISRIFDLWGLRGILTATMLMTLACTAALTALLARYTKLPRAMLLAAFANLAMSPLQTPQPWLFTILFFTVELYLLLQACERNRPAWLLPIIPLSVLWANIHIQFVYGVGLICLFALLGSMEVGANWMLPVAKPWKLRPVWLWGLLAASILSTLVNPFSWRLYSVVIQYATDRVPFATITELQASQFRDLSAWTALLIICCAWFSLGTAPRKSVVLLSLMAISCWFGFRSVRDVWFPVVISALALASRMRASDDELRPSAWACWAVAVPLGMILAPAVPLLYGPSEPTLQKFVGENLPDQASAYIRSHALNGPLYNSFDWGGYLIWRLPELPVTIDGRWPVFRHTSFLLGPTRIPEDLQLTRAFDTAAGKENWAEDPELRKANVILIDRSGPLASILRSDPRFRLVYEDKIAAVFQPRETAQSTGAKN